MAQDGDDLFTLTAPVILSHPQLFEAKQFKDPRTGKLSGDPKFSGNLVFAADSADLADAKKLAAKVARANPKWAAPFPLSDLVFPFKNGTVLADKRLKEKKDEKGEFQRGKVILVARSKFQPRISYLENGKIVDAETEAQFAIAKSKLFFGAEVLAQVRFVTHEVGSNKPGVNAYLQMILATGKGTKLAGGASGAEAFKGYVGHATSEDPTGGGAMDDDIPF